jgi:hypothetical protein
VDIYVRGSVLYARNCFPSRRAGAFCAPCLSKGVNPFACELSVAVLFWRSVREKTTKGALQTLSEMDRWKDYTQLIF